MARFTPAQLAQAQAQWARYQDVARTGGWNFDPHNAWETAVRDVATANNMDPELARQINLYDTSKGANPGSYNFDTAQGIAEASKNYNEYLADQQGRYNRVDEIGPYGSAKYEQNPDGTWTRRYELSENQALMNAYQEERDIRLSQAQKELLGKATGKFGDEYSYSQFGDAPSLNYAGGPEAPLANGDFIGERKRIENSVYDSFNRRMEPRFQDEQERFRQRMADQGIPEGSELYTKLQGQLDERQNDARLDAASRATMLGGEEYERSFDVAGQARDRYTGEQKDVYDYGDRTRSRQIAEYADQRYAPWREQEMVNAARKPVVNPTYQGIAGISIPGVDIAGLGLGFKGLEQDMAIANLQAQTAREGHANALAVQGSRNQAAMDRLITQYGIQQANNANSSGGGGGYNAAANIAGSIGSGFAAGAANNFFAKGAAPKGAK